MLFRQVKTHTQSVLCFLISLAVEDDIHYFADIVDCFEKSFEDMLPLFRYVEVVFASSVNDFALKLHIVFDYIQQSQLHRTVVDDSRHIRAEVALQIRLFQKKRNHRIGVGVFFEFYHAAHTRSVRFVDDILNITEQILVVFSQFVYSCQK